MSVFELAYATGVAHRLRLIQTLAVTFPPPSSAVVLQLLADVVQPEPPAALSGRLPAGERRGVLHQPGSGLRGQRHLHARRRSAQHQHALQPVPELREREQVSATWLFALLLYEGNHL